MKKIIYFLIISLFTIFCNCSGNSGKSVASSGGVQDSTKIVFVNDVHDFGMLKSGESVACSFSFTNEGDNPLLISEVTAGCGCTNVKYPLKPVAPGKSGTIEVKYNTRGKNGHQRQMVTVYSNGSQEPVMLIIRANVQE
jgi:hypothetical protein